MGRAPIYRGPTTQPIAHKGYVPVPDTTEHPQNPRTATPMVQAVNQGRFNDNADQYMFS